MGVDTGNGTHSSSYSYYGQMLYPSTYAGTRAAPIDLTDSPPRTRITKRKASDETDDAHESPANKKPKSKDEEKRLRRFRSHAPTAYGDIRHRALTQRMFVIDRWRHGSQQDEGSLVDHAAETVKLAGTTGNIYTITIDRLPSCDCPHARKGNQCKHVVYVLARVLKAPYHLEYQLAFLSSDLKEIFAKAPPLPAELVDASTKDGNRKPLDDSCPICFEDFDNDKGKEDIVYCKAACGNNIHKGCFAQWARAKAGSVTCPLCRSPWEADDNQMKHVARKGRVNDEGYVNVASQLGLSGLRDYSTYNQYWARGREYGDY